MCRCIQVTSSKEQNGQGARDRKHAQKTNESSEEHVSVEVLVDRNTADTTVRGQEDESWMTKMQSEGRQDQVGQSGGDIRHGRPCDHLYKHGGMARGLSVYSSFEKRSIRVEVLAGALPQIPSAVGVPFHRPHGLSL